MVLQLRLQLLKVKGQHQQPLKHRNHLLHLHTYLPQFHGFLKALELAFAYRRGSFLQKLRHSVELSLGLIFGLDYGLKSQMLFP